MSQIWLGSFIFRTQTWSLSPAVHSVTDRRAQGDFGLVCTKIHSWTSHSPINLTSYHCSALHVSLMQSFIFYLCHIGAQSLKPCPQAEQAGWQKMDIKYKMMQMYLGWLKWGCTDVTQTENIVLVWEEVRESSSALRVDRDTSCPFLKVLIWVSKYNIFGPYTQTPCALLGCETESKIFISCLRASLTSNMKSQSIRCQKSAWDPPGSFPGMSDRQCEISQN